MAIGTSQPTITSSIARGPCQDLGEVLMYEKIAN